LRQIKYKRRREKTRKRLTNTNKIKKSGENIMRTNPLAGNTRDWQNAPHWQKPHTRSPTANFETPSPTASTTPANSVPGVKGRGGWINQKLQEI
jgi:hypothetical protein